MPVNYGAKLPLTKPQSEAIQEYLHKTGQWRDLALFMLGIDTHLRSVDFLCLKVSNIRDMHGQLRPRINVRQQKNKRTVKCCLSQPTRKALAHWIYVSQKQDSDYLFTRLKSRKDKLDNTPIGRKAYALRVKSWVTAIGLDPEQYSTKTLRKSRVQDILAAANLDYQVPQQILGHADIRSTIAYCGLNVETALAISEQVQFFKSLPFPSSTLSPKTPI